MQSALFTYRRRVLVNGTEVLNDNYINPIGVTSFYWQTSEEGNRSLSVFLTNQYTITFGESVGKRFCEHMEDFLRYMIAAPTTRPSATNRPADKPHTRRAIQAEVVEDEEASATEATWVQP